MSSVDFGETLNSQKILTGLQAQTKEQGTAEGILNEKNAELLQKLNETSQELCLLLLETQVKSEQAYVLDYIKLLRAELERMQALETKPS